MYNLTKLLSGARDVIKIEFSPNTNLGGCLFMAMILVYPAFSSSPVTKVDLGVKELTLKAGETAWIHIKKAGLYENWAAFYDYFYEK